MPEDASRPERRSAPLASDSPGPSPDSISRAPSPPGAAFAESAAQLVAEAEHQVGAHAGGVLPMVLSDVPVAVLLIDLTRRTVTYANQSAVAMSVRGGEAAGDGAVGGGQGPGPGRADQAPPRLPMPLDQWGSAAGLTDLSGQPLAESANPLSRLATGNPVSGEAIRVPATQPGTPDRTLWVTGFPLSPFDADEQLALVVFLEVAQPAAVAEDQEAAMKLLRDRAIIATDLAFTITDPRRDGNPLVWVNPAFTRVTGYDLDEVRGRNCRFLQGPATDRATVAELADAVAGGRPITRTLLNYRKDGSAFWNQVAISPVFDGDGNLVSFVGVQTDVTERVRAETEREDAYAAERSARQDAERSRARLAILAEASVGLGATLDVEETIRRLAEVIVPALADWVIIRLSDDQSTIQRSVARHRDGRTDLLRRYLALADPSLAPAADVYRVLDAGEAGLVAEYDDEFVRRSVTDPEARRLAYELGTGSLMYVPLVARRRRILGVMTFVSGPSGRRFTTEDLEVAAELGRRAGLTLDNARLYEREHRAAETLQRSLLPDLPEVAGLDVAARYLPGDSDADVGGDWYEVLPLPDGSIGLAVGDVVGHDLSAAAAMGHLRGLLRACAWNTMDDGHNDPAMVLQRVDRLMQGLHVVPLATLLFARLEPPAGGGGDREAAGGVHGGGGRAGGGSGGGGSGGGSEGAGRDASGGGEGPWRLAYANAGHPPLLRRRSDGTVDVLDDASGILLGVASADRRSAGVELHAGDCLVAYTDGLVERRGESIDAGLKRLVDAVATDDAADLEAMLDRLITADGGDRSDDTAVLAVRITG